jgi:hypothetical protein
MPVLTEFIALLGMPNPHMVLMEAQQYLPAVDSYMKRQTVAPEDRIWILTRLGYFIGELLVQRFAGCWFLDEIPDSRYFLRYVVGRFARIPNPNAMVEPFYTADVYLSQLPEQSLTGIIDKVVNELANS